MSRIGQSPIDIPAGVTAKVVDKTLSVSGGRGDLSITIPDSITVEVGEGRISLTRADDSRESKSMHGLTRSLAANMVIGVSAGFTKRLEIEGVGYRAAVQGKKVVLSLGFAGPKEYVVPDSVTVTTESDTKIVVTGADKQQVGLVSARIRGYSPCEPYKGKGIRYEGERIRRKVGKTVA